MEIQEQLKEIGKLLKTKKLIFGTETTIKNLKKGRLSKVFLSSNCPDSIKEDIKYYSKISNTDTIQLEVSNEELSQICKKPFSVSIVSIIKE
jgi:large subunit ribosomal protein L30e